MMTEQTLKQLVMEVEIDQKIDIADHNHFYGDVTFEQESEIAKN